MTVDTILPSAENNPVPVGARQYLLLLVTIFFLPAESSQVRATELFSSLRDSRTATGRGFGRWRKKKMPANPHPGTSKLSSQRTSGRFLRHPPFMVNGSCETNNSPAEKYFFTPHEEAMAMMTTTTTTMIVISTESFRVCTSPPLPPPSTLPRPNPRDGHAFARYYSWVCVRMYECVCESEKGVSFSF